jgi:predicted nucleic acid-binding protein
MKILVDINIFMDAMKKRKGWLESTRVINLVKNKKLEGFISALTPPIIYFHRLRFLGEINSRATTKKWTEKFKIVPLTEKILTQSLESYLPEFEDNIQFYSAKKARVNYLITRNKKHFQQKEIKVFTPDEFLETI